MADDEKTRLLKSITQENDYFSTIIDTIPPDHYGYDESTKEMLRERKHMLVDQKLVPGKRAKLTNKTKSRLAQLDERQCHTNSQIFEFLLENSRRENKGQKRKADDDTDNTGEKTKGKGPKKAMKEKKSKWKPSVASGTGDGPVSGDRQGLLAKLQLKLDEMRAKRGLKPGAAGGIDFEEKKRLARKLSKAKLKEKRRREKEQHKTGAPIGDQKPGDRPPKTPQQSNASKKLTNGVAGDSKSPMPSNVNGPSKKRKSIDASPSRPPSKKPAVIDKDGRMVFSKFDFAMPGVVEETEKDKWANKNSGKDYKRLLEKQERLEGKMEQLQESGKTEAAKKLKEKTQWDAAAQRAKGAKVKDDTTLLKKNLKRKEKRVEHSKRKWDTRNENTQRKQAEKQQKRKENIKGRKKDNKDRKLTKARKKGRLV